MLPDTDPTPVNSLFSDFCTLNREIFRSCNTKRILKRNKLYFFFLGTDIVPSVFEH